MVEKVLFIVFAALAVGSGVGVITRSNIVHALILLIFSFVNVAAIYLLTSAFFIAVVQILVYAGAILVLFTFVVMFLNLRQYQSMEQLHPVQKWVALIMTPLVLAEFVVVALAATWTAVGGPFDRETVAAGGGNVALLGERLFNDALLPFEIASLILLVAMVGAVVLAAKEGREFMETRAWADTDEERIPEFVEEEV